MILRYICTGFCLQQIDGCKVYIFNYSCAVHENALMIFSFVISVDSDLYCSNAV